MDAPRYHSVFLTEIADAIRRRHYSIRTEQAYVDWIRRFILFHGKRHPRNMGEKEVADFLTYLAVERNVAASTQNPALNAPNGCPWCSRPRRLARCWGIWKVCNG